VLNTHSTIPDGAPCHGPATVILGGGIIGGSTAFYLAEQLRQSNSSACIYILDSSSEPLAGASGHPSAVLHYDDFRPETQSLGRLSWDLHKELASKNDGRDSYAFSPLAAYNITIAGEVGRMLMNDGPDLKLPRWFKNWGRYVVEAEPPNTAPASVLVFTI
jgi:glycine/D-amino acid oxidase-like deaminating enzyme